MGIKKEKMKFENMFRKSLILLICFSAFIAKAQHVYTLKNCIDSALKNNISYNNQLIIVNENEVNLKQYKMNRIPTLNGSLGEGISNGKNFNTNLGNSSTSTNYSSNVGLNSSIVLFNGFKNNYLISQNNSAWQASKFDAEVIKNSIITSVINSYLQVLYSYEAIAIAEEQVKTSEAQVVQTERLLNVGKIAETALLQIKSQHANDKLSLVNAENNLQLNRIALYQLMEIPVADNENFSKINIDSCIMLVNPEEKISRADIFSNSLSIMPEIKSSRLNIENASWALKAARADILPKLSINGGLSSNYYSQYKKTYYDPMAAHLPIGYLASDPTQQVMSLSPVGAQQNYPLSDQIADNFYKNISIGLSIPIFNNSSVRTKIKLQQLALKSAKLNEHQTENTLRKSIEQAYTQYVAALKQYAAGNEQLTYAAKSYESVKTRFTLGIVNPTELQVEKNNYLKAESDFLQMKYQMLYAAKMIEYYKNGFIKIN